MYDSITPPEWYRNVIFGVLAHGLVREETNRMRREKKGNRRREGNWDETDSKLREWDEAAPGKGERN